MFPTRHSALEQFVNRLSSRSVLIGEEQSAVLGLPGHVTDFPAHTDFVQQGEQVLYIPGDMADLPSVVSPKAGWGLAALTGTTILHVRHADLRRLAAQHPGLAEAFWRDCVADGSIFSEWVVNVGRRDAVTRLSHLFCEMAIRCERAGQGDRNSFALPATQTDLGNATGLTNVHINRTLKELRTRSILTTASGKVTVHDWDKLVSTGDFNDAFMLLDGPSPRIAAAT
jgi:CRP-like cAMP-binding protein